jgi:hypothetical protein
MEDFIFFLIGFISFPIIVGILGLILAPILLRDDKRKARKKFKETELRCVKSKEKYKIAN